MVRIRDLGNVREGALSKLDVHASSLIAGEDMITFRVIGGKTMELAFDGTQKGTSRSNPDSALFLMRIPDTAGAVDLISYPILNGKVDLVRPNRDRVYGLQDTEYAEKDAVLRRFGK